MYISRKYIFLIAFLNETEPIYIYTQLNGFKYFSLIWIILYTINYLFAHIFERDRN